MKVTYNWLKNYTDFDYSPEELVQALTMLGLEVDSLEYQKWNFDGVVIGEVVRKDSHRNADKLWVCEVNIGGKNLSIVCGAPNVEVGQKVPVAVAGTRLPDGRLIEQTVIRGVESQGMICSEAELGLSKRSEGIMVLDHNAPDGKKLRELLGEGDAVIDIDVTPNRPDCFGVIGIAREIAALSETGLRKPDIELVETDESITDFFKISVLDTDKCPRYTARYIRDVKVKPSPWWLAQKLEAVGVRSINNIVDVTNYVMMETGQPLHAFDADLLKGHEINVKTASEGEKFTTLDEKSHVLNSECLMICDKERSVAVGGVMGGLNSEVSSSTVNILLESAYFNPINIRRTSKYIGNSTESSKRFERGVDPNGVTYALDRAAQLIAELSGGKIAKNIIDVYPRKIQAQKIALRPQRIEQLLGVSIPIVKINSILARLDFKVTGETPIEVEVPTFRPDITREADLIEEVARLYGYDNIAPDTSAVIEQLTPVNLEEALLQKIKNSLIAFGFSEVMTYNLANEKQAKIFSGEKENIRLLNPLSEDFSILRPSLVLSLLNTVRWNVNRDSKNLKLFEIGTAFSAEKNKVREQTRITGILTGLSSADSWKMNPPNVDIFDVKGTVANLLKRNKVKAEFQPFETAVTNTKTLSVQSDGKVIGFLGEIRPDILATYEIEQPVFVFDLDYRELLKHVEWQQAFTPIPKFPSVKRDIAVVLEKGIKVGEVIAEIKANGGPYLHNVTIFDVYTGKQVAQGLQSVACSLTFYSLDRTLIEEEIDTQMATILSVLSEKFSARLRE